MVDGYEGTLGSDNEDTIEAKKLPKQAQSKQI
jgi:hypothetical protein